MVLVLLLAVFCALAAAYLAASQVLVARQGTRAALARVAEYGAVPADEPEPVRRSLVESLGAVAQRLAPSATLDAVATKLAAAGVVRSLSPGGFVAVKAAAAASGFGFGVLLAFGGMGVVRGAVVTLLLTALGLRLPDLMLGMRVRARREQVLEDLPNALDLLAVSVEAGLGLDAAVARLVDSTKGALADELNLLLAEFRVGAGRHEVLRRFAERVPAPETAAFVRAVVQADKLGTSLSNTLRVQAREVRAKRQAVAEEKAGKAPVRMLFPTVIFIFPALFVVVFGPALMTLAKVFK